MGPTCYGDPGKVSDIQYVCDTDDRAGCTATRVSRTTPTRCWSTAGPTTAPTVTGIGLTKAAHIWYQAQTNYLTPVSNFADMADALEASCADLVGKQLTDAEDRPNDHDTYDKKITAADCTQVHNATVAVQLRNEPMQCNFGPLLDPNTPARSAVPARPKTRSRRTSRAASPHGTARRSRSPSPVAFTSRGSCRRDLPPGNLPAGNTRGGPRSGSRQGCLQQRGR